MEEVLAVAHWQQIRQIPCLFFSHRAFTPFWPALASSKKESVSGSLAACKMKGETAQNAAL